MVLRERSPSGGCPRKYLGTEGGVREGGDGEIGHLGAS